MERDLTETECRVLGCLLEKAAATPDQYPLSINALVQACNQKSNREPVMQLDEGDVRATVTDLTRRGLVRQASAYGGRVSRFEHRLAPGPGSPLNASPEQRAVLCLLLLRGPQTAGELRARGQRLADFADVAAVERALAELLEWDDGPLVECLPREPGRRESRWRHCLGGEGTPVASLVHSPAQPASVAEPATGGDLEARVAALESAVAELRRRLDAYEEP